MKTTKSIIAIILTVVTFLACFALPASAANACSEVNGKANLYGGNATVFRVKTANKKIHYVKMVMTKGKLGVGENGGGDISVKPHNIYGYYEIEVFAVKNGKRDVKLLKVNVKNADDYKIKIEGYTEYEIKIWNWRTVTIAKNRGGFVHRLTKTDQSAYAEWEKIPTWKISKTNGVSYCSIRSEYSA